MIGKIRRPVAKLGGIRTKCRDPDLGHGKIGQVNLSDCENVLRQEARGKIGLSPVEESRREEATSFSGESLREAAPLSSKGSGEKMVCHSGESSREATLRSIGGLVGGTD